MNRKRSGSNLCHHFWQEGNYCMTAYTPWYKHADKNSVKTMRLNLTGWADINGSLDSKSFQPSGAASMTWLWGCMHWHKDWLVICPISCFQPARWRAGIKASLDSKSFQPSGTASMTWLCGWSHWHKDWLVIYPTSCFQPGRLWADIKASYDSKHSNHRAQSPWLDWEAVRKDIRFDLRLIWHLVFNRAGVGGT